MSFKVGDKVSFNYRSARGIPGRIVGVYHKGKTDATTGFKVQPAAKYVHPGEKVPVHRTGKSLRHLS